MLNDTDSRRSEIALVLRQQKVEFERLVRLAPDKSRDKPRTSGMPTLNELEGGLNNAKDTYRDQQAEIERLKAENEQLKYVEEEADDDTD